MDRLRIFEKCFRDHHDTIRLGEIERLEDEWNKRDRMIKECQKDKKKLRQKIYYLKNKGRKIPLIEKFTGPSETEPVYKDGVIVQQRVDTELVVKDGELVERTVEKKKKVPDPRK